MASSDSSWPFDDPPDLGVLVSRRARAGEPVTAIDHYADGDWLFLTDREERDASGQLRDDDLLLVHLRHVLEAHPEVVPCADLPRGQFAQRQTDGSWLRGDLAEDDQ